MPTSSHVRVRRWQATAILTLFFIAVAGAAAIGWWYARESPAHQGPIVVISVDGLPASALATSDPAPVPSGPPAVADTLPPLEISAIAALARESVVFERAYTHSPQVLPAHASLLTGQLPFEHGVRDDGGYALAGAIRTLPELLRNRGFATGGAVSSFLLREDTGIAQGFTFYDAENPDAATVARDGLLTIDAAEQWARRQQDRRYFLLAQVDAADAELAVARVVGLLEEQRWYDSSTIVLVGDRGRADAGAGLDEESLRVPLLIKQPAREGAGRHVLTTVQHIDLVPTILDLVRAPVPGNLRGRSLKPVLAEEDERIALQPIYSEWLAGHLRFGADPMFALTLDDRRYVRGGGEEIVQERPSLPVPITGDVDVARAATDAPPVPDGAADALAPFSATLDRLLDDGQIAPAAHPSAAVRTRLALAGYLHGLPPVPGTIAPVGGLDETRALAAAHQAAARLAGERRLPAAIRALQAIVRSHPGLASIHYQIGVLSMDAGRPAAAVAAFRAASDLRPDLPEITRALALALAKAGDLNAALAQASLGVALARAKGAVELARSYQVQARIALLHEDEEKALEAADAAQAADPSIPMRAFIEGRLFVQSGRHADAARLLRDAALMLEQHGATLEGVYASFGDALAAIGAPLEAERAYRNEIRAFPDNVKAYTGLIALFESPAQHEEIERVIEELLRAVPTPEAYAAAAGAWAGLGQRARADALRSEARSLFRGDLAQVLLARERGR